MQDLLEIAGLMVLSGLKFFLAPSTVVLSGYDFWPTIIITITGGLIGFFIFFYFGQMIQGFIRSLFNQQSKKKFSKRSRLIVKIKRDYGLWGLAILTPCLFSIPIGAILASIYYANQKGVKIVFALSIALWSFILTSITIFIKHP